MNQPTFVLVDVHEPMKHVLDTGGVPGQEMRLVLDEGSMTGLWKINQFEIELNWSTSYSEFRPTVKLYIERLAP